MCDTFSLSWLVLQYREEGDEEKQAGVFFYLTDTLPTWENWSSLPTSRRPKYLSAGAEVSLRVTEIAWLPQQGGQQNIKLSALSFLSWSVCFMTWFFTVILLNHIFFYQILLFVSFKLFPWPLWVFLSFMEWYQQFCPRLYIYTYTYCCSALIGSKEKKGHQKTALYPNVKWQPGAFFVAQSKAQINKQAGGLICSQR